MKLPRILPLAAAFGALSLTGAAMAAPDNTGSVSASAPTYGWEGASQRSFAPLFDPALCSSSGPPRYCEQTLIEVKDTGKLVVKLSDFDGGDVDLFVHVSDASGTAGEEVGQSINSGDSPETVTIQSATGYYLIYANYFDTTGGGGYKGNVTLTPASAPAPAPAPAPTAGPAPAPSATPAPGAGALAPSGKLRAQVKLQKARLKGILKSGVPVSVGCSVSCKGKLTLTAKVGRKKMTIGSATVTVTNKQQRFKVKLSKKARSGLKRARRVKVALKAVLTDASGGQSKRLSTSAAYKK